MVRSGVRRASLPTWRQLDLGVGVLAGYPHWRRSAVQLGDWLYTGDERNE